MSGLVSAASVGELTLTGLITLAVAMLAAFVGYRLRAREWLKEKRLDAYTELLDAFNEVAVYVSRVFSVFVQLGPKLFTPEYSELHAKVMNDASAAFMRFDHANDAATLLASEDTHAAMTALNAYVNDLLKMPPYAPSNDPDAEIPNSTRDITLGARDITAKFIEKAAKDIGGNAPNRTALSLDIPPNGEPSVTP